jgi:predicted RNA-binding protein YlxR (DUF448 family)
VRPASKPAKAAKTLPPKASENVEAFEESGLEAQQQRQDNGEGPETVGSLRRCVVTRTERSPGDLLRFVVDPSGSIVPDLARKLPGRGVWVTADKITVSAAVAGNAFAKSLKCQVTVAPDLSNVVEILFVKRALDAFSLANKAGVLTTGFEKVEKLLDSGGAFALVHGSDAAADGRGRLDRKFAAIGREKGRSGAVVDWLTIEELSLAIGRANVVHAGLKQGGATQRFLREAERLQRYRSGLGAS